MSLTRTIQGVVFTEGQSVRVDGVILRLHAITKRGLLLRPISPVTPKPPEAGQQTVKLGSASAGDLTTTMQNNEQKHETPDC